MTGFYSKLGKSDSSHYSWLNVCESFPTLLIINRKMTDALLRVKQTWTFSVFYSIRIYWNHYKTFISLIRLSILQIRKIPFLVILLLHLSMSMRITSKLNQIQNFYYQHKMLILSYPVFFNFLNKKKITNKERKTYRIF